MIKTGVYIIQFYSRVGTKMKDLVEYSDSLMDAVEAGDDVLILEESNEDCRATSYTIDRRTYNSLDKHS